MEIFLNDLSLAGQFADSSAFRGALQPFLELRSKRADLQRVLYCSGTFSARAATPVLSVREAVLDTRDRLFIGIVLQWLTKSGPFWDEERFPNPDDYFEYEDADVTDQGLGEASRRTLGGLEAGVFSFVGDPSKRFERTPLVVTHGLNEAPLGHVPILNLWLLTELEKIIDTRPTSWKLMVEMMAERFNLVKFSPEIIGQLDGQPFHAGVVARLFALFDVLQTLAHETREDNSFTERGVELWQKHTVGDKAWFTDESEANKIKFRSDLTFRDSESGSNCFCPWHGKVKLNQFRVHFEWPRPQGQKNIKVMYVGPKITRN